MTADLRFCHVSNDAVLAGEGAVAALDWARSLTVFRLGGLVGVNVEWRRVVAASFLAFLDTFPVLLDTSFASSTSSAVSVRSLRSSSSALVSGVPTRFRFGRTLVEVVRAVVLLAVVDLVELKVVVAVVEAKDELGWTG